MPTEESQTALAVSCAGKCAGENNSSTIDSVVSAKVVQGRSSGESARNADWEVGFISKEYQLGTPTPSSNSERFC